MNPSKDEKKIKKGDLSKIFLPKVKEMVDQVMGKYGKNK